MANVVILKLTQSTRRTDRFSVVFSEESSGEGKATVTDESVLKLQLRPGAEVDGDAFRDAVEEVRAHDLVSGALARRSYAVLEMRQLLRRRGVSAPHAEHAVRRFAALGVLDDERFAASYARNHVAVRGASVWSLRRALARKGVARDVADSAIEQAMRDANVDEYEMAVTVGKKKLTSLSRYAPDVARRRLTGFLQRRGYSGDTIRRVLRDVAERKGGSATGNG
ncbi:MAG TPA: regulatory protein RecX [Gemmatimonadaceae bacterium]|nr:regulatory protein RecX [Gemmatimonadaceae bacterium]